MDGDGHEDDGAGEIGLYLNDEEGVVELAVTEAGPGEILAAVDLEPDQAFQVGTSLVLAAMFLEPELANEMAMNAAMAQLDAGETFAQSIRDAKEQADDE